MSYSPNKDPQGNQEAIDPKDEVSLHAPGIVFERYDQTDEGRY
jgi:hypothetical protein